MTINVYFKNYFIFFAEFRSGNTSSLQHKESCNSRSPLLATPVVRISLHFMIVRLESLLTAKFISRFIGASSHR